MNEKDIFGIPLVADDYIVYHAGYNSSRLAVGQIKSINETEVTVIGTSTYSYETVVIAGVININDKIHLIDDVNGIIATLTENEYKINERQLEAEQKKDIIKAEKNKLKREMKPGDCFQTSSGYCSYFMYLGVVDKKHIFTGFNKNYRYRRTQGDADYEFSTASSKFYQEMKTKKTALKKFTTPLNTTQMFKDLEQEIHDRPRYCSVTQADIDKVKALYNKLK